MSAVIDRAAPLAPAGLADHARVLIAVGEPWVARLLAVLPHAEVHRGDVHFAPTPEGPGLRPGSVDVVVVGPEVDRREALRPVLRRDGVLLVVGPDGVVRREGRR